MRADQLYKEFELAHRGATHLAPPTRSAPMRQPRSIRFHLSSVFIFFFLLIFFLGMLSIARLRDFNNVSADIADVWLPNTRVLGDLNNYTSAFRAAAGHNLLSSNATESEAIEREMIELG